ncbi:hypothetical protein ABOONEI_2550 [Aciduliprofundum boonei T469]|nr:hypothetical protein ABOONEI_2550 [Aciduliprofundum boonei T469]
MDEKVERILKEIKRYLKEKYGDKIKKVILYGSYARGEATEDSDVDDSLNEWDVLDYLAPLLGKFMDDGFVVTTIPVREMEYNEYPLEFFYHVKKEGIPI